MRVAQLSILALIVSASWAWDVNFVKSDLPGDVVQYSGYITVNGTYDNGAHLFFWFFESRNSPTTDPFVMWLTGGPGCSSELALFYENGPYIIQDDLSLKLNPYSWNSFANLLYIDNPVGSGFSYADSTFDYVTNEQQVAQDLYTFLQEFFQKLPKYKNLDFYIAGESYAGHYVPAISYRIIQGNTNADGPINIKLKGSAIGNGWVDPYVQYSGYSDYALLNKYISDVSYDAWRVAYEGCKGLIDLGLYAEALEECQLMTIGIFTEVGAALGYYPNIYNLKQECLVPPLCYNFTLVERYLALPQIKQKLGVGNHSWVECSTVVHIMLTEDWVRNLAKNLPPVLAAGVRVLVYSGMNDFICNWVGGLEWSSQMPWPGQSAFDKAQETQWMVDNELAGYARSAESFTFLRVVDAGHMVPLDQPERALNMLKHFLNNTPF